MKRHLIVRIVAVAGLAWSGACEGYDPPEQAEPADTIAPAPTQPVVPGADEPGPQENP